MSGGGDGKCNVYLRLRPLSSESCDTSKTGPSLHELQSWTVDSMTAADIRGVSQTFTYPRAVIPPEVDQEQTFHQMNLPEMIDKFLFEERHCTLVAYGQTGSGKTHTMFGPGLVKGDSVACAGEELPSSWGLFPRTIVTAMQKMKRQESDLDSGVKFVFSATVTELYFWEAFDLLNNKSKIQMSAFSGDFDWEGLKEMVIEGPEDIQKLVDVVFTDRHSRATAMNERSSRSHCIASLNLTRVDTTTRKVYRSSFMFCDLSGSERTSKTGHTKSSFPGLEGIVINYDLSNLHLAVEVSCKVKPNSKKKLQKFDGILPKVLRLSLTGESLTSLVVCLSQAKKNGSESYYSLKWGSDMSRLNMLSHIEMKGKDLDAEKSSVEKQLKSELEALQNLERGPTGKSNPCYPKRVAKSGQLRTQLDFLSKLLD